MKSEAEIYALEVTCTIVRLKCMQIEQGVYALCRVGGWYKILGRSESQAVKKPSNRGVATLVREHTAHPPTALALRQTS